MDISRCTQSSKQSGRSSYSQRLRRRTSKVGKKTAGLVNCGVDVQKKDFLPKYRCFLLERSGHVESFYDLNTPKVEEKKEKEKLTDPTKTLRKAEKN